MINKFIALSMIIALCLIGYMYHIATSPPIIRKANIGIENWPKGQGNITILSISDIHVAGPDMPPSRLSNIVNQINKTQADLILFAGDFVSDKSLSTHQYTTKQALAPLAKLQPRLAAIAVMGNHDHWRNSDMIIKALKDNNITILNNHAAKVGPLVIGGIDDDFTGRADITKTLIAMEKYEGIRIALSHSPDVFPELPADIPLTLAGHTHCGQISFPFIGPLTTMSRYGRRFACGIVKEGDKTIIVGAGVGTSILPLRLGSVPDMWLINIGMHPKR